MHGSLTMMREQQHHYGRCDTTQPKPLFSYLQPFLNTDDEHRDASRSHQK